MRILAALAAALGLVLALPIPAYAQFDLLHAYFIALDTSPTTQVFNAETGAFVAFSDATYNTWLTNGDTTGYTITYASISAASNAAGLARLTVNTTAAFQTGQKWHVSGTGGVYDGNWTLTVIDATHVDLQSSTFTTSVTSGSISGPSVSNTLAALWPQFDSYAQSAPRPGYAALTGAGPIAMTNPTSSVATATSMARFTSILASDDLANMPNANSPNSIPKGIPFYLFNANSTALTVRAQDGTTTLFVIQPSDTLVVISADNTDLNGTWSYGHTPECDPAGAGCIASGTVNAARLPGPLASAFPAGAPTISSGFCGSPSVTASNGAAAFDINVGTTCGGSTGVIALPTAANGWVCNFVDISTGDGTRQTAGTTSTVTVTHFTYSTGAPLNFQDSDHIRGQCSAY